jgi:2-isopropylmalate synthase
MPDTRITIFDTTLRDGEQSPGCSMNLPEKLRLARQLERLGVDVIEAGFPIASDGDFEAVAAVAREVRRPVIAALARAMREDMERAWAAVRGAARPRLHVFLATSDIHLETKLKITREQCLRQAAEAVALARSLCPDVEFSAEDAMRTGKEFLGAVVEAAAAAGATTINLPDTVGYCLPSEIARMFVAMRAHLNGHDEVVLSTHCHDDLGLAVANSIASLEGGARQVECTVNGIGERAGNASLEELVMALRVRGDALPFTSAVQAEQLYPSSRLLTEITGVAVQPNKAIVGRNAFAHEAGIHQDGVIKNPLTYEIMTPQSVGVPEGRLVLGKHSGRHALAVRLRTLGFTLERRDLDRVYRRFVALADDIKVIEDRHLLAIISEDATRAGDETAAESAATRAMSKTA